MPISLPLRRAVIPLLAAAAVTVVLAACTVQTASAAPGRPPAVTNAAPAEPQVPTSVFINPTTPEEGRDPFFPQSTRTRPQIVVTGRAPAVVIAELELKGISGTVDHRLAIINNRTFEVGEEGTVLSNVGRVRLVCKEINEDSVRVILNNTERTLTMRTR